MAPGDVGVGRIMINRRRVLLFVGLVAAITVGQNYVRGGKVKKLFGGSRAVEIVARPDEVQAYRLGHFQNPDDSIDAKIADYPRIAGPVNVSKATAEKVSNSLLSPSTYYWLMAKACMPRPGVLLSFVQGEDQVDVLFCFECDILIVGLNGEQVGSEDFDFARAVFVAAAKECFPDDQEIQALNEER